MGWLKKLWNELKDGFKLGVEQQRIKKRNPDLLFLPEEIITVSSEEYGNLATVCISDDYLTMFGQPKTYLGLIANQDNQIWANKKFAEAPIELQRAMVAHELGHMVNKDVDKIKAKKGKPVILNDIQAEIAADSFAAGIVGEEKIKTMLNYLINIGFYKKPLLKRLKASSDREKRVL